MSVERLSACLPAEFEQQAALLLGVNELLPIFPQVMIDIVDALIDRIPVVGIVTSEEQRWNALAVLCDWGLPAHLMRFVGMPVKGMWVRDYGPSFVRKADGSVLILDAEYLEADRPVDDHAPSELAELLRVPVLHVPMTAEGGNMLSNGQGICLSTTTLVARNAARGYTRQTIEGILKRYYGFEQCIFLNPLITEPTGHVDMFATFTAPDTVVVGSYDPRVDPVNADILDANAAMLSRIVTRSGPLKVVRIPMPTNHGGVFRTYTNVVYANGTMLVPVYPDVDRLARERAMDVYRSLLPDWELVGIDASPVIGNRGALRCVTLNIPWLDDRFALAPRARRNSLEKMPVA